MRSRVGCTFYSEDRIVNLGVPNIFIPLDLCVFLELVDDMTVLDLRGLLYGMGESHAAIVGRRQRVAHTILLYLIYLMLISCLLSIPLSLLRGNLTVQSCRVFILVSNWLSNTITHL